MKGGCADEGAAAFSVSTAFPEQSLRALFFFARRCDILRRIERRRGV